MDATGLFHVRFMDDILVLAPTRWTLRRAVKAVNEGLQSPGLEKHPEKIFIGRIERGFDFLGYHFSRKGLKAAKAMIRNFVVRAARLYAREREESIGLSTLEMSVTRWIGGSKGGFGDLSLSIPLCYLPAAPPQDFQLDETNGEEGERARLGNIGGSQLNRKIVGGNKVPLAERGDWGFKNPNSKLIEPIGVAEPDYGREP